MRRLVHLAALLLTGMLPAAGPETWIPARWQGGPLELRRLNGTKSAPADPAVLKVLRELYNPETLGLLAGTPINCLLVTWSTGAPANVEAEQQSLLAKYIHAAHQRRIAVLGLVFPGADLNRAAVSAAEAGLGGLVLETGFDSGPKVARQLRGLLRARKSPAVVIPLGPREWLLPDAEWPVLGTNEAVAARITPVSESDTATATPTAEPWINSNSWLVRSLRAWGDRRPVWLGHGLEQPSETDYERAIADAAVAGGRWVLAPDAALLAGVRLRKADALATWERIRDSWRFFEEHAGWRAFTPAAALGIIQDEPAKQDVVADENLNLINRRRIPYRVLQRRALTQTAIAGMPAVLATALAPPTAPERKLLAAFASNGGLLITGPSWGPAKLGDGGYAIQETGSGRIVLYKQDPPDPETLSKDLLDLLGPEGLPVRLFNAASLLAQVTSGPGGAPLLVQLVNYATEPAQQVTVRAAGQFRRARLFTPGSPPVELKINQTAERSDARIVRFSVHAAVLFER
jgi:hypothetical protein